MAINFIKDQREDVSTTLKQIKKCMLTGYIANAKLWTFFVLTLFVKSGFGQVAYMSFKIENRDAIWQQVYKVDMDSASLTSAIASKLKSSGYVEQVEEVDGRIVFNLKNFIVDYKKFGGSFMTTAFAFSNGQWDAKGSALIKDGKYRITLSDIRNHTEFVSIGGSLNGTSHSSWSELCLNKARTKFKDGSKGEIGMLDRAFNYYFELKKIEAAKSDW